ncbi:MAG TPA: PIG-L family deacetylase [Longilinea sp.]|nr:PIG-L family deacetylase [Longilinea sp.]
MGPHWIYLSPHLDDVALSCGGIIRSQVQAGNRVEIWTIFAGNPPAGNKPPFALSLEERWQTGRNSTVARRAEDIKACEILNAQPVHFDLPDCIYRRLPDGRPLIDGEADLWQPIPSGEQLLVEQIASQIAARMPPRCRLVIPLSMGDHIDHRLVRAAGLCVKPILYFYADYPYSARSGANLNRYTDPNWQEKNFSVSKSAFTAWQTAIACYESQITSLWVGLEEMHESLAGYYSSGGGKALWIKTE